MVSNLAEGDMSVRYSKHVDFVENDPQSQPPRHRRVGWVFSEFFLPTQEAHGSMYFTTYPHTADECPFGPAHAIAWGVDWSRIGGPIDTAAGNYRKPFPLPNNAGANP